MRSCRRQSLMHQCHQHHRIWSPDYVFIVVIVELCHHRHRETSSWDYVGIIIVGHCHQTMPSLSLSSYYVVIGLYRHCHRHTSTSDWQRHQIMSPLLDVFIIVIIRWRHQTTSSLSVSDVIIGRRNHLTYSSDYITIGLRSCCHQHMSLRRHHHQTMSSSSSSSSDVVTGHCHCLLVAKELTVW